MRSITFYRYAIPEMLHLWRLRAIYLGVCALRVLRGLLVGRWPWEVIREIREERRRMHASMDRIWKAVEDVLREGRRDA